MALIADLSSIALSLFAAVAFAACGNGPHLVTTGIEHEFANNQNPLGLLEARSANGGGDHFGATIGHPYGENKYCGVFLRHDGMVITHAECLTDSKSNSMVVREDIRIYMRHRANPPPALVAAMEACRAFQSGCKVLRN